MDITKGKKRRTCSQDGLISGEFSHFYSGYWDGNSLYFSMIGEVSKLRNIFRFHCGLSLLK